MGHIARAADAAQPDRGAFDVTCVRDGDDLVVRVVGDLDVATWERPVAALEATLPTDAHAVVVDLGDVTFLDSSGLGCLVRLRSLAHDHDLGLTLRGPRPAVVRLLRVTGLDGVFDVKSVSGP